MKACFIFMALLLALPGMAFGQITSALTNGASIVVSSGEVLFFVGAPKTWRDDQEGGRFQLGSNAEDWKFTTIEFGRINVSGV